MSCKALIVSLLLIFITVVHGSNVLYFLSKKSTDNELCPDGGQCPTDSTCCELASGKYGCCPMPNATCCDDHVHCCPSGYTCDLQKEQCVKGSGELLSLAIIRLSSTSDVATLPVSRSSDAVATNVVCPGSVSCPEDSTCCPLRTGVYGCCPTKNAVCCSDHVHCCPSGYTCDVIGQQCHTGVESIEWLLKQPAIPSSVEQSVDDIASSCLCGKGRSCCDGMCCPFENGVCCGGGHCCPFGTTCDEKSAMCKSTTSSLHTSWNALQKQSEVNLLQKAEDVQCPDQSQCQDGNTCCLMTSGHYGCCPYASATCCSDKLHCCPNGMQCDVEHSRCVQSGKSLPWEQHSRRRAHRP